MPKRDQIDDQIANYLNEKDCFWLFGTVMLAMDDLEDIDINIFDKGGADLWAAGLIYALVRHNELEEISVMINLKLDKIGAFYGIDSQKILSQVNQIYQVLELNENNPKYREFDLSYLEEAFDDEPNFFNTWNKVQVDFENRSKIDRPRQLQFEELCKQIIDIVNADEDDEDKLRLLSIEIKGRHLYTQLEGYNTDIKYFCDLLEEKGPEVIEITSLIHSVNIFTPSDHYITFIKQHESMNLEQYDFKDRSEVEEQLEKFKGKTIDEIQAENPISPESEAVLKALKAFSLPKSLSIAITNQILNDYPNCIEAHICLAGWEQDAQKRIDRLERALDVGEQVLDIDQIDQEGLWWGYHRTRPYMRAIHLLALQFIKDGRYKEGTDLLWELIDMNEVDNQGNRFILLEFSIIHKLWSDVRELFAKYPDDHGLSFVYGKVIYLYYTLGRKAKTKKALIKAYKRNKYPIRLLAGIEEYPEDQPYYQFGDKTEATEVIDFLLVCFEKDKKLIHYFLKVLIDSGVWDYDDGNDFESFDSDARIVPFNRTLEN